MRLFSLAAVLCMALAGSAVTGQRSPANRLMRLDWNLNPAQEEIDFYTVHVSGPRETNLAVSLPPVELTNLFRDFPNGEYQITVTATGKSALTSEPSAPLFVFWYGNTPGAPNGLAVSFP